MGARRSSQFSYQDFDQFAVSMVNTGLWVKSILIALTSFLYGYTIASLNSCFPDGSPTGSLLNDIDLSDTEQQAATAITIGAAGIGSLVSSIPSDTYGKRRVLILINIIFVAGGLLSGITNNMGALFAGRFLLGIATGLGSMIAPTLLTEISPIDLRGTITTLHQLFITIGILVAGLVSYGFVTYVEHGWKYVQFGHIVPAIIQFVFGFYVPESPRWLVAHGQLDQAKTTLASIREGMKETEIHQELELLKSQAEEEAATASVSWNELLAHKKPLTIGFTLMFFQAMTGINSVMFYSTKIFGFAGVSEDILATTSVGCVNVIMTIISVYLVDRAGRRSLLVTGTSIMVIMLAILGIALLGMDSGTAQGVVAVLAVLGFVCGFAIGLGAVAWVLMSELMPARLRGKASSLFIGENWVLNFILAWLVLTAINGLGGAGDGDDDGTQDDRKKGVAILYLLFAGIAVLAVLFLLKVPETKGKTETELQQLFSSDPRAPLLSGANKSEVN